MPKLVKKAVETEGKNGAKGKVHGLSVSNQCCKGQTCVVVLLLLVLVLRVNFAQNMHSCHHISQCCHDTILDCHCCTDTKSLLYMQWQSTLQMHSARKLHWGVCLACNLRVTPAFDSIRGLLCAPGQGSQGAGCKRKADKHASKQQDTGSCALLHRGM